MLPWKWPHARQQADLGARGGSAGGPHIKVAGDKAPQGIQKLQVNSFIEEPHSSTEWLGLQLLGIRMVVTLQERMRHAWCVLSPRAGSF